MGQFGGRRLPLHFIVHDNGLYRLYQPGAAVEFAARKHGVSGQKASSIHSVAVGYLTNMAVPRAGEVARCTALNRLENIPISKLLGTVVLERAIDFLMLFLFLCGVLLTSYNDFLIFLKKLPS